jgi:hypothetical protein
MLFCPLLCALCVNVLRLSLTLSLSLDICLSEQPRAPRFGVPPIDFNNYIVYFVRYVKKTKKRSV